MIINDDDRRQIDIDITTSVNPSAAVLTLVVGQVSYTCTWLATATQVGTSWKRTARTDQYFAGPLVPTGQVAGAVVLSYGTHQTEVLCRIGDTTIASRTEPLTVRS